MERLSWCYYLLSHSVKMPQLICPLYVHLSINRGTDFFNRGSGYALTSPNLLIYWILYIIEPEYCTDEHFNFEYNRQNLDFKYKLGEGQFGCVYKAEASDIAGRTGKTTVAVKVLKGKILLTKNIDQ